MKPPHSNRIDVFGYLVVDTYSGVDEMGDPVHSICSPQMWFLKLRCEGWNPEDDLNFIRHFAAAVRVRYGSPSDK